MSEKKSKTTDVSVYVADVTPLLREGAIERALKLVSPERREKTLRLKNPADQALSLGGELLLRRALADRGLEPETLEYRYGKHKKPYLKNVPGFFFSISHSGSIVMAAAASKEVGCDVEEMKERGLAVAKRFFHSGEAELLMQAGKDGKTAGELPEIAGDRSETTLFYRLWTLKESFLKVTGKGLSMPMSAFRIDLTGDAPTVECASDRRAYCFTEIDTIAGYAAAVCVRASKMDVKTEQVDLKSLF